MTKYLWRWNRTKDDWELMTTATDDKLAVVLRGYKRRDARGIRFKWTDGTKPKKFRTRAKKGE